MTTSLNQYNSFILCRLFSTTNILLLPFPNDQDDLIHEINSLGDEFNDIDRDIEEFTKQVNENEENFLDSDDEDDTTELTKVIQDREKSKDDLVGTYEEARDRALFDDNDVRDDKSLMLELIERSTNKDIETLNYIKSQLADEDDAQEIASNLIERLENQGVKASELQSKWHENDLPPIVPSNDNNTSSTQPQQSFPQDSSDVHQTDFNSFDPFDE